ncbi:MAG TPA: patatin-like phospholipase family protein, partial [Vicinamibacterales bacterium]|nr:patatin-like phospholipase family protein [Vicinamibacterales bacterium]
LGVLRHVLRLQMPVRVIVGVSAGAIIAAYYAAVGLTINDMVDEAPTFRGRHIVMHGLTIRAHQRLKPLMRRFCGVIPKRLAQLEDSSFSVLHHGVEQLGVVCHDLIRNQPCYFSTTNARGVRLADVVRASAAVPGVMPSRTMMIDGEEFRLADGGLSDPLPVEFARSPGLDATHLIVSDCRYNAAAPPPASDSLVYIRPDLGGIRPLRAPRFALMKAVWQGEAAVTNDIVEQLRRWNG